MSYIKEGYLAKRDDTPLHKLQKWYKCQSIIKLGMFFEYTCIIFQINRFDIFISQIFHKITYFESAVHVKINIKQIYALFHAACISIIDDRCIVSTNIQSLFFCPPQY